MTVSEPGRPSPVVPRLTHATIEDIIISKEEVERQLQATDSKKALGPDGLSPHILKHCASPLAVPVTAIFQLCLSTGKWPALWKVARVAAIHKKATKTEPKNDRPVSLLPVLGKTLESLIVKRLSTHLDNYRLLSNRQFGFLPTGQPTTSY